MYGMITLKPHTNKITNLNAKDIKLVDGNLIVNLHELWLVICVLDVTIKTPGRKIARETPVPQNGQCHTAHDTFKKAQ
jgi:hypothetical protein